MFEWIQVGVVKIISNAIFSLIIMLLDIFQSFNETSKTFSNKKSKNLPTQNYIFPLSFQCDTITHYSVNGCTVLPSITGNETHNLLYLLMIFSSVSLANLQKFYLVSIISRIVLSTQSFHIRHIEKRIVKASKTKRWSRIGKSGLMDFHHLIKLFILE